MSMNVKVLRTFGLAHYFRLPENKPGARTPGKGSSKFIKSMDQHLNLRRNCDQTTKLIYKRKIELFPHKASLKRVLFIFF
jgi:hypothetical protein